MHRKIFQVALVAAMILPSAVSHAEDMNEDYPVPASEMKMRDPFVIADKEDGCYYIITSRWKDGRGGLAAYKSRDLKNWRDEGFVFNAAPDYLGTDDFWAPDTYKYKGDYYVFVTLSNKSRGILRGTTILKSVSGSVLGPYEPVLPADRLNVTPDYLQSLDGSLYVDDDGKPWIIYAVEWCGPNVSEKVGEVWAQRLKEDLTDTCGEPYRLFRASDSQWALHIGGGGMITDAPFIVYYTRSSQSLVASHHSVRIDTQLCSEFPDRKYPVFRFQFTLQYPFVEIVHNLHELDEPRILGGVHGIYFSTVYESL